MMGAQLPPGLLKLQNVKKVMAFNLADDPWVPVRRLDGSSDLLSLNDLFARSAAIAGLDAAPHERVSLMRLLVCLAQAALGAPAESHDWPCFGSDMSTKVPAYLARADIHPYFELFGPGLRFLQVEVPAREEPVPSSKLMPHLATGNNPTLFDHAGGTDRSFSPSRLALALLTFQNFYPLYGAGYKGKGPCADSNMAHTLLHGGNLAETILLNALDAETIAEFYEVAGMGRPLWETGGSTGAAQQSATRSYLGRLVPRHRNLWLHDDGKAFNLSNESLQYPNFEEAREPSATVKVTLKTTGEERRLLPLRQGRGLWRDLDSIAVLRTSRQQTQRAPLTLQSHIHAFEKEEAHLWVGGLVTDLKAKILDTAESSFTVPYALFKEEGRAMYENGVAAAQTQSQQLYGAVKNYAAGMKHESAPHEAASRHYWNTLDQESSLLLSLIGDPGLLDGKQIEAADSLWGRIVRHAARAAYDAICQRLTPRQHKAYIEGLRVLFPKPKSAAVKRKPAMKQAKTVPPEPEFSHE
ncbi:MAG: type I-E CRISPR-associated protein Cse1/CasA [Verrucomicrobiaceae bacterium]|nr:MAG: type I-E CRISPR-associated protein Cse1/CasA [Verrucomicrobiaceae bacterium]